MCVMVVTLFVVCDQDHVDTRTTSDQDQVMVTPGPCHHQDKDTAPPPDQERGETRLNFPPRVYSKIICLLLFHSDSGLVLKWDKNNLVPTDMI